LRSSQQGSVIYPAGDGEGEKFYEEEGYENFENEEEEDAAEDLDLENYNNAEQ
jgi:hypothetical protein